MAINRVTLSGNLTRDPELRTTSKGNPVLKFSLAVNDRRMVNGAWEDYANFFDCIVFGKRADGLAKYLSKGTKVCLMGKLSQSRWEDNGQRRSKTEIMVEDLDFMSSKSSQKDTDSETIFDVDIPF